jgi:hypothetical protein
MANTFKQKRLGKHDADYADLVTLATFANLVAPATAAEIRRLSIDIADLQRLRVEEGKSNRFSEEHHHQLFKRHVEADLRYHHLVDPLFAAALKAFPCEREGHGILVEVRAHDRSDYIFHSGEDIAAAALAVHLTFRALRIAAEAPGKHIGGVRLPPLTVQPIARLLADQTIFIERDFVRSFLLAAIDRCDIRRLGVCPICDRLFATRRKDQKACDRYCADALRHKNARKNAREKADEYNEHRRRYRKGGIKPHRLARLNSALRGGR